MTADETAKAGETIVEGRAEVVPQGGGESALAHRGPTTPMTLLQIATEQGADLDKLERLMGLQERWEAEQARKAFAAAMARFQGDCPVIRKNASTDRYTYATLGEIRRQVRAPMEKHGLSASFFPTVEETKIHCICRITHEAGHSEDTNITLPVETQLRANDSQRVGAGISYAKRYALCAALNIVVDEEDDDAFTLSSGRLGESQVAHLQGLIAEIRDMKVEFDLQAFLQQALGLPPEAGSLADIPASKFGLAIKWLNRKLSAKPKFTPPKGKGGAGGSKKAEKSPQEPSGAAAAVREGGDTRNAPKGQGGPTEAQNEPSCQNDPYDGVPVPERFRKWLNGAWKEAEGFPKGMKGLKEVRGKVDLAEETELAAAVGASYIDETLAVLGGIPLAKVSSELGIFPEEMFESPTALPGVLEAAKKIAAQEKGNQ